MDQGDASLEGSEPIERVQDVSESSPQTEEAESTPVEIKETTQASKEPETPAQPENAPSEGEKEPDRSVQSEQCQEAEREAPEEPEAPNDSENVPLSGEKDSDRLVESEESVDNQKPQVEASDEPENALADEHKLQEPNDAVETKPDRPVEYESFHEITASSKTETEAASDSELLSKIEAWRAHDVPDDDLRDDQEDGDFKLPEVNWENLEARLRESAATQADSIKQGQRHGYGLERDEVRRKLAMVSSSSSSASSNDPTITVQLGGPPSDDHDIVSDYLRSSHRSGKSHYIGQNLQICFMNESINDDSTENESAQAGDEFRLEHFEDKLDTGSVDSCDLNQYDDDDEFEHAGASANTTSSLANKSELSNEHLSPVFPTFSFSSGTNSCEDVLLKLQSEAKQAFAQVKVDVKQKLDAERNTSKKPSPIADIVGLPTYGLTRLERDQIVDMNIGQLQVIVNDLCNQIERINEELKKMLIDRDDLYMQQDALLVDVEDFTKRIQELSSKKKKSSEPKPAASSDSSSPSSSNSLDNCQTLQHQPEASAATVKSFTPQSIGNKVSAFFNHYSHHNEANNDAKASTSTKPTKLFSSFTNKLYRFKK